MAISEFQLSLLSQIPHGTEQHKLTRTYKEVSEALKADAEVNAMTYEVYLQGSYANDTNIKAESDVDIVLQLNDHFYYDDHLLSPEHKAIFTQSIQKSNYPYDAYKMSIFNSLRNYFGEQYVEYRGKCIRVKPNQVRISADVIAAWRYKNYHQYSSGPGSAFEGIRFFNTDNGESVTSYPRIHIENNTKKHQATNEKYKPLVRIYKNIKSHLIDTGAIPKDGASSFCVESLIFNVPNDLFDGDYTYRMVKSLVYLLDAHKNNEMKNFVCPSRLEYLFNGKQWDLQKAKTFLDNVLDIYLSGKI